MNARSAFQGGNELLRLLWCEIFHGNALDRAGPRCRLLADAYAPEADFGIRNETREYRNPVNKLQGILKD